MTEEMFDATCAARDAFYASVGHVEPDVIAHAINPAFMGGPMWPALRQAFSVIRRGSNTIVASNGLSDPFDDIDEPNTGFGIEIYAETQDLIGGEVSQTDLFQLVYATAQQAACSGRMAEFVRTHGVITMGLYADDCGLHAYQNEAGEVGIMIGVEHPQISKTVEFPGGEVIFAAVQILTPDELAYVVEARAGGRQILHGKLKAAGIHHMLTPGRASLLASPMPRPDTTPESTRRDSKKPWWKVWSTGRR